jgi:diadenosine tetraphosphate (Ap4A) HIT family hydrolase
MSFVIDSRLSSTCYKIAQTNISTILLSRNSLVTWFIIVPKTDKTEWFELGLEFQMGLNQQTNQLSKILINDLKVDKINFAALGNVVPQLHLHVIGRRKDDAFWPNVVWEKKEFQEYIDEDLNYIKSLVTQNISMFW